MAAVNGLYEEIIIAGFGGQGIISSGKLLAQTAMDAGKEVTYMPSYGAEVRGGTANCMLVIADAAIACPLVSRPGTLIAMSKASSNKYCPAVKENGLIIINSSLIDEMPKISQTVKVIKIAADDIAIDAGSVKAANMAAMGAYLQLKGVLSIEDMAKTLEKTFAKKNKDMLAINLKALQGGADAVEKN